MAPRSNGNRVALSGVSVPPEQLDRLNREEDDRTIGKSKLVEKGLDLLFASFDAANRPDKTPTGSVADTAAQPKP